MQNRFISHSGVWRSIRGFLFWLLVVSGLPVARGEPVDVDQARRAVNGWLKVDRAPLQTLLGQQVLRVETFSGAAGAPLFYVAYLDPEGYAVLSADDLIEPIIAFSSSGTFEPTEENPLYALVRSDLAERDGMAKAKSLPAGDRETARRKWGTLWLQDQSGPVDKLASVSDVRIAPLTQTLWSQGTVGANACYNYYTPPNAAGSTNNCVCGCVATAMAQLMRYWRYPSAGVGTNAFSITVYGANQTRRLRGGNGLGGAYNWDEMILDPRTVSTLSQRQAIGALCADAGVAANMNYAAESGANHLSAKNALKNTFQYANAIRGHNNGLTLGVGLSGMVNANLDAGCPVMLGITRVGGGHSIVADGYGYDQSTLYHHLNLGWGGSYTAWYNLPTVLSYNTVLDCIYNIWTNGTGEIISGRVTDNAGTPLSGVTVIATRSGGGTYTATTDARGIYALPRIPSSSSYTVHASKAGSSFTDQAVSTGLSADSASSSGNRWGINFTSSVLAPTYTVTFNAQSGSTPVPATLTVTNGMTYGALATTTRAGYTFGGWWTGVNGTGSQVLPSTPVTITANQTLYAKWTGNAYTVTFDAQGGTAPSPATIIVTNGLTYEKVATTTRTGYTFGGWWTGVNGAGTQVTPATAVALTAAQTLYAKWIAIVSTVTFDAQGGTAPVPTALSVTYGTPYGTLATTTRAGFSFGGWWTGINGTGVQVSPATVVAITSAQTLYAKWVGGTPYLVTFDSRGGTTPVPSSIMVTNGLAYGPLATASRTGYSFGGWWTGINGTGTQITPSTVANLSAAQTLYAKWVGTAYTLTFDARSGTAPVPASKTITNGLAYGPLATTTRSGYTFSGWWTLADGTGSQILSTSVVAVVAAQTVYAKWVGNPYVVTFDAQGGTTPSPASITVTNGLLYGTLATTTRAGYTFGGWWTGANGTGTQITPATVVTITSAQTVYAKWSANPPPIVTFDGQGGTAPVPATKTVTNGLAYGTLATTTRAGYTFGGWWTGVNGAGSQVTAGTVVTLTANHTLYAKWLANTYTVTFDGQGGTTPVPSTKTVTNDMTYGTLPTTTRSGYSFGGWWTLSGGAGSAVTPSTLVSLTANQTVYAKWTGLGATTILNETFEGDFPGGNHWTLYGAPTWDDTSWIAYQGGWSGYCAGSTNPNANAHGPYAVNMNAWMEYGPFSLADASAAQISLMHLYQCESNYDELMYAVSLDGELFYPGAYVYSGQSSGWSSSVWSSVTLDLANSALGNLCGQTSVWFAIIFMSDGSIQQGGAFVDNILIQKTTSGDNFTKTGMATLNGTVRDSLSLSAGAALSGSFPYAARNGINPNANVIAVVGLVDNSGQWVGGTPQAVYNGIPSQAGVTGTAPWSNLTVPAVAGTYYLRYKAYWSSSAAACIDNFKINPPDSDLAYLEGLVGTITVTGTTPQPDLIVQSISHTPANPNPGESVTFRVTLKNQGAAPVSGIFNTGFWTNRTTAPAIGTAPHQNADYLGGIMPGATYDLLFVATAPGAGTYTAWAYVDRYEGASEIDESNEANNAGPTPSGYTWTVGGASPKPDLIVQSISHTPANPNPGDTVTFTVTLKNQGAASVSGIFNTGFWSSRVTAPDISASPDRNLDFIGTLGVGATTTLTFTVTAPAVGSYAAWAYVDRYMGASEIDESNEGNNSGPMPSGYAWAVGSASPGGDAWDPLDNTASGGTVIVPQVAESSHGLHTLTSTDQTDWFKIYLSANVLYNFNSRGGSGDTVAELYADTTGLSLLATDDDSAGNLQFSLDYTPTTDGWRYLKVRTFSVGSSASYTLKFNGTTPLGAALEQPLWDWLTYGYSNWFGQALVTHDGVDAVRSGMIPHSQSSWMEVEVTGPGTLSFWWKVSSEAGFDKLGFWVDDEITTTNVISGDVNWRLFTYRFSSGVHTAYWGYLKDSTISVGSDCGWVDEVVWQSHHVISDYNGDGVSDYTVFDPVLGSWYIRAPSGINVTWNNLWGWNTAKPVPGDYDGDGRFDLAVFDTKGGFWYLKNLDGTVISWKNQWGWSTAKPVPGDYDGDGKYDLAVFDTAGGYWYIKTVGGSNILWRNQWGWSTAKPVPGDYDGDGIWDLAVFDSQGGYWYIKDVAGNTISWRNQWGWSTAKPVPGDYDGDGKYDLAVFDTAGGYWYIKSLTGSMISWRNQWGWSTAKPVSGDFNGDGKFDLAIFDVASGYWYVKGVDGTVIVWAQQWGWPGVNAPSIGD